jgi:hypothetical protein
MAPVSLQPQEFECSPFVGPTIDNKVTEKYEVCDVLIRHDIHTKVHKNQPVL